MKSGHKKTSTYDEKLFDLPTSLSLTHIHTTYLSQWVGRYKYEFTK